MLINNSELKTKQHDNGVSFDIKLTPNSSRNAIIGIENGVLKVKTTAVPEKGKANKELIKILSKHLKTAKSNIEIIKGLTDRNKTVLIKDSNIDKLF